LTKCIPSALTVVNSNQDQTQWIGRPVPQIWPIVFNMSAGKNRKWRRLVRRPGKH